MKSMFWLLIFLIVYGYLGYPLVLFFLSRIFRNTIQLPADSRPFTPMVSILIAAFNEEKNIAEKIRSLLIQDYPPASYDIWVLDDGSTDQTASIVTEFSDQRIHLLSLPRGGKATALNHGVEQCGGEILVFSDADTIWQATTLTQLVAPFSLTTTGAVAGRLQTFRKTGHLGYGDKIYHHYESAIRLWETALASAVSADGGLFALRKELWQPLPQDVTDDFFISTAAVVNGRKIIFCENAVAFDTGVEKARSQLKKRVRITVRGLTSLWRRQELFNPLRFGWYSLFLFSHKLIRRLVPAFFLLVLPANLWLMQAGAVYQLSLVLQLLFYGLALSGLILGATKAPKFLSLITFMALNGYGVLKGVMLFLVGKRYTSWVPEQNR